MFSGNGEWWKYPWWFDKQYYNDDIDINTIKNAINILKDIFDSSWIVKERNRIMQEAENYFKQKNIDISQIIDSSKENDYARYSLSIKYTEKHPLFLHLVSLQGKAILLKLVDIGSDLDKIFHSKNSEINNKEKFINNIKKKLRKKEDYAGALFELNFFSCLSDLNKNFSITYEPELNNSSGKKPDFAVSSESENLIIELKTISKPLKDNENNNKNNKLKNKIKDVVLKAIEQIQENKPALILVGILDLDHEIYAKSLNDEFKNLVFQYKNVSAVILFFNKNIYDTTGGRLSSDRKESILKLDFIKNECADIDITNYEIIRKIMSSDNFKFRNAIKQLF